MSPKLRPVRGSKLYPTRVVTSIITILGGYMVCTLVRRLHQMRNRITKDATFTYSYSSCHNVGNALNFKTVLLQKSYIVVWVVFLMFFFQPLFIIFENVTDNHFVSLFQSCGNPCLACKSIYFYTHLVVWPTVVICHGMCVEYTAKIHNHGIPYRVYGVSTGNHQEIW